jgi:hypothetical protein
MNSKRGIMLPTQERFEEVFSRLSEQDVEQFHAHYQLWTLRHRIPILEQQIETLREHIEENQQIIQNQRPPAIALAVLARLQSKGVSNVELLDQLLERGEDWLDEMMQRLDYCEQVEDFIQGDYTQWCLNSLEGAYDWIDSLRGTSKDYTETAQPRECASEAETLATEELLLQKLRTDDEEAMMEVTLKLPIVNASYESQEQSETLEDENLASIELKETIELASIAVVEEHQTENAAIDSKNVQVPLASMADWEDLESVGEPSAPWYNHTLGPDESPGHAPLTTATPDQTLQTEISNEADDTDLAEDDTVEMIVLKTPIEPREAESAEAEQIILSEEDEQITTEPESLQPEQMIISEENEQITKEAEIAEPEQIILSQEDEQITTEPEIAEAEPTIISEEDEQITKEAEIAEPEQIILSQEDEQITTEPEIAEPEPTIISQEDVQSTREAEIAEPEQMIISQEDEQITTEPEIAEPEQIIPSEEGQIFREAEIAEPEQIILSEEGQIFREVEITEPEQIILSEEVQIFRETEIAEPEERVISEEKQIFREPEQETASSAESESQETALTDKLPGNSQAEEIEQNETQAEDPDKTETVLRAVTNIGDRIEAEQQIKVVPLNLVEAASSLEPPQKLGFWQKLFKRKRKDTRIL